MIASQASGGGLSCGRNKTALEAREIVQLLPHRAPALLLDRVLQVEPGKRGVGVKNLSLGEPIFQGHFPAKPIYPGVLIIESCAQLVAVVLALVPPPSSARVGYLASVERFKFVRAVGPGDVLYLEAEILKEHRGLIGARVAASLGKAPVASGVLTVTSGPATPTS